LIWFEKSLEIIKQKLANNIEMTTENSTKALNSITTASFAGGLGIGFGRGRPALQRKKTETIIKIYINIQ
jgi:hypothetical protein